MPKREPPKPDPHTADQYGVPWYVGGDDLTKEEQSHREFWIFETWMAMNGPTVEELLRMVAFDEPVKRTEPLTIAEACARETVSRSTFDRWWMPRLRELDPPGAFKIGGTWRILPRALDELREERATVRAGRPATTRRTRRPLQAKSTGDAWEL